MTKKIAAKIASRRRVSSLVGSRQTLASLIREVSQPETPDTCLHFGIAWRTKSPAADGRLHATCACGSHVSRSAFAN